MGHYSDAIDRYDEEEKIRVAGRSVCRDVLNLLEINDRTFLSEEEVKAMFYYATTDGWVVTHSERISQRDDPTVSPDEVHLYFTPKFKNFDEAWRITRYPNADVEFPGQMIKKFKRYKQPQYRYVEAHAVALTGIEVK